MDKMHASILEKQKYFQSISKFTHMKAPVDRITSVAIPLAFVGIGGFMIVRFTELCRV